jgi:hypothetical protein
VESGAPNNRKNDILKQMSSISHPFKQYKTNEIEVKIDQNIFDNEFENLPQPDALEVNTDSECEVRHAQLLISKSNCNQNSEDENILILPTQSIATVSNKTQIELIQNDMNILQFHLNQEHQINKHDNGLQNVASAADLFETSNETITITIEK